MITRSIKQLDLFRIADEVTGGIHYGADQEWYRTMLQRLSGCGPSTAANILFYLFRRSEERAPDTPPISKRDYVAHMEDVWQYVTPSTRGIPSAEMLCEGVVKYTKAKDISIALNYIDIPKSVSLRPTFGDVLAFVGKALNDDTPVAFLNLNNGEIKQLDSWHWVTIISLDYEPDGSAAFADILDAGQIKRIDFATWFRSTTLGGGLVSMHLL